MRTVEISPLKISIKKLGFITFEYESTIDYKCGEDQVLVFQPKVGEIKLRQVESEQTEVVANMQWDRPRRNAIGRFTGTITGDGFKLVVSKPRFRPKTISLSQGDQAQVTLTLGWMPTPDSTDENILTLCSSKRATEVCCAEEILLPATIAGALTYAYMFEILYTGGTAG